jgi:DNA-binding NarL/FixJ family response regulator
MSVTAFRPSAAELDRGDVSAPRSSGEFSPRELRVLGLLADGYRTSEIALELAYSERTIKHSISALTSRLQLRNRTQAVAIAVREGLI